MDVIATMRTPRPGILPNSDRLRMLALDVTSPESIATAIDAAGPIDALVNNAGIDLIGALEATPMAKARQVFETNTFGVIAMTQAVVPQFRARRSGVIVNVMSSATLAPMPLASIYTASKMAIGNSPDRSSTSFAPSTCASSWSSQVMAPRRASRKTPTCVSMTSFRRPTRSRPADPRGVAQPGLVTTEADVAEAVWRAANDESGRLRFPAGPDAVALVHEQGALLATGSPKPTSRLGLR